MPAVVELPSHLEVMLDELNGLGLVFINRLTSVLLYSVAFQQFTRQNPETQVEGADYGVLANFTNIGREFLRYINNRTAEVNQRNNIQELRSHFQAAHLTVIPLSFALLALHQAYVLLLPAFGRSPDVVNTMRWVPLINWLNSTLILVFTVQSNFAYGMRHLLPMTLSFCGGGLVVFGSYFGMYELTHSIHGFLASTFLQSVFIASSYYSYLKYKLPELNFPACLFARENLRKQFKESFEFLLKGRQTAFVYFIETLANMLTVIFMGNVTQLGAYQSMLLFPVVASSAAVGIESNMTSSVRNALEQYRTHPAVFNTLLRRKVFHQVWPVFFLAGTLTSLVYSYREEITSQLVAPTAENAPTQEIVVRNVARMSAVFGGYCLRAVFRGVVLAFRSEPEWGERYNQHSTWINISSSLSYFVIGFLSDKLDNRGASGYVLSLNIMLYAAALSQLILAGSVVRCFNATAPMPRSLSAYPQILFPSDSIEAVVDSETPDPNSAATIVRL